MVKERSRTFTFDCREERWDKVIVLQVTNKSQVLAIKSGKSRQPLT